MTTKVKKTTKVTKMTKPVVKTTAKKTTNKVKRITKTKPVLTEEQIQAIKLAEKRSNAARKANKTRREMAERSAVTMAAWKGKLSAAGKLGYETKVKNYMNYVAPICNAVHVIPYAHPRLLVAYDVSKPIANAAVYDASNDVKNVRKSYVKLTEIASGYIKVVRLSSYLKKFGKK